MAHLQGERPQGPGKLECSQLSIEDVECIQIRKAFCAAQIGLSDFIRYFAEVNGIEGWFDALKASVSRQENTRMAAANEDRHTWVGDMCVCIKDSFF
jgi:hypothetical protein